MQIVTRLLVGMLLLIGLSGCASLDYVQGTKVSDDQVAKFTKGKTTKNEVVAALGGPQDFKLEGGKQILMYKYQKIAATCHSPLMKDQTRRSSSTTRAFLRTS